MVEIDEEALKIIRKIIDQNERIVDLLLSPMVEISGDEHGDPFEVDWSKAPGWAMYHAFSRGGEGMWFGHAPTLMPDGSWWQEDMAIKSHNIADTSGRIDFVSSVRKRPA